MSVNVCYMEVHPKRRRVRVDNSGSTSSVASSSQPACRTHRQSSYRASMLRSIPPSNATLQSLEYVDLGSCTEGKIFTVDGVIKEIEVTKEWHYTGCPTCNQIVYATGSRWFCTRHEQFVQNRSKNCGRRRQQ